MKSDLRAGESNPPNSIRSDRFFNLNNYWFFATREGASVGPYDSKEQAIQGVADYIEFVSGADPTSMDFFRARDRALAS